MTEAIKGAQAKSSGAPKSNSRDWIFPKKPKGNYYKWRTRVSWVLLAVLFTMPFIKVDGHPFILLNVFEGRFIIFGQIFWPSDFYILLVAVLSFILFIALFTVIFGRLWCGWACPQTVFMEMVFRKIEYWIEGDALKQKKLDKQPWNREKVLKRGSKLLIFFVFSFIIGNLVMAYLIGVDEVQAIVTQSPTENLAGFLGVLGFTGVFFWVFAYFREQACTIVCPYGRLQSVLIDKKSVVVSYDWKRGENRAKNTRNRPEDAGDCVDCNQCVDVCPTGIDIRKGLQLECVSCTACIDACNFVMDKVNKPQGLIRHTSEENIESGTKWKLSPRIMGYSGVLVALLALFVVMLSTASDINVNISRAPGSLYMQTEEGEIRNLFQLKVSNKTYGDMPLTLRLEDMEGEVIVNGEALMVPAENQAERLIFIDIPRGNLEGKTQVKVGLYSGDEKVEEVKTNFFAPVGGMATTTSTTEQAL